VTDSPSPTRSDEGLSRELDRVVRRVRSTTLDALPAGEVHAVAQQLEGLCATAQARPARTVPRLAPYAAADQLAVLGRQVLQLAQEIEVGDALVAERLRVGALAALVDLRRAL
jgi:hypothetical protein